LPTTKEHRVSGPIDRSRRRGQTRSPSVAGAGEDLAKNWKMPKRKIANGHRGGKPKVIRRSNHNTCPQETIAKKKRHQQVVQVPDLNPTITPTTLKSRESAAAKPSPRTFKPSAKEIYRESKQAELEKSPKKREGEGGSAKLA